MSRERCGAAFGAALSCGHTCRAEGGECPTLTAHPPGQPRQIAAQQQARLPGLRMCTSLRLGSLP